MCTRSVWVSVSVKGRASWSLCSLTLPPAAIQIPPFSVRDTPGSSSCLILSCTYGHKVYNSGSGSSSDQEQPAVASIAEQLALLPAVTVTSLSTTPPAAASGADAGFALGGGTGGGLLGSRFPATASAGIHLCLPPGAEYASAVQAFQEHCTKVRI